MAEDTLLDLDNLDNLDVSTVEAAPEFIEPPTGRYKLSVQVKKEEGKPAEGDEEAKAARFRFIYSVVEVVQLKDKNELLPAIGSLFSESFSATQEGLKYWKQRATAILGDLGKATIKEVNEQLGEAQFTADVRLDISKAKDKDGNIREYKNIRVKVISEEQQNKVKA